MTAEERLARRVDVVADNAAEVRRILAPVLARGRASAERRREKATPSPKEAKKATKRAADRAEYEKVRDRDGGLCTVQLAASVLGVCGGSLEIDHQWGRGKEPTKAENCRMLCHDHHRRKTDSQVANNVASRLLWLCDFREFAVGHEYYGEIVKTDQKIALYRGQHPRAEEGR